MNVRAGIRYDEVIETNGIKVPFVPEIITPPIEGPMRKSRYEGGECAALRRLIRPGDRVLELGSGVGLLSTVAALGEGVEAVTTVEANPALIPLIKETHRLNDTQGVRVLNGVAAAQSGPPLDFFVRQHFWASSMEPDSRPFVKRVKVPSYGIGDLIAECQPTVIVCDIEGGELGLFDQADLSGVRLLIIEFHRKVYGRLREEEICDVLETKGLALQPENKKTTVRRFMRGKSAAETKDWPPADPRVLVTTCMKDEGPYILEWLAWHKSIGIQEFVVFTNDCTDGTDDILDRLEAMGELRRIPNPALATGSSFFQPHALAFTPHLPEWKRAEFYLSMDVDEFVNIRVGKGHIRDLLTATGPFDALSMCELNHGSNGHMAFEPGLVTELFPLHQPEMAGWRKAQRGVKTLSRITEKLLKPRNHRPDFHTDKGDVVWLNGSAHPISDLAEDPTKNGIDSRKAYDLVSLDHFALRSLEGYLLKMHRGDVVRKKTRVGQRYWRLRNINVARTSSFQAQQPAFRDVLERYFADPELQALHDASCAIHAARAKALMDDPIFRERRDWILENAWPSQKKDG